MCTLDIILELIDKNNIKQKDLTDYLGISKNAFTNWKGGFSQSYNRYLPQIAEFFNVSIDYLAGRTSRQGDLEQGTYHGGRLNDNENILNREPTILPYSGNERIDSIAKEILKTDLSEEDLKLIEFILDKYKR